MSYSELNLESKTETVVAKAQNYIGGTTFLRGGTIGLWENHILGGWGHCIYFVGVWTLYNIVRKSVAVGGRGGRSKLDNNTTLWLHLVSWNLLGFQPS